MFRKTVLDNGIRILTQRRPDTRAVSIGIWVENGSRHEGRSMAGISHFVEHLLFKGTKRRTAQEIAEVMDSVGGIINAFTGKEYTCYYAKVLDDHLDLAVDVLTDIFRNSTFEPEEIERERSVILQEIAQADENPEDFVHDLFSLDYFGEHALGRPICGTVETVSAIQRDDLVRFVQERYLPGRVIITVVGNVEHDALVDSMAEAFARLEPRDAGEPVSTPDSRQGVFHHPRPLEQIHICMGVPGVPQAHDQRYEAHILNTLLGGGMSSRLFQEVREKRGKAYSVYSFLSSYSDLGYLAVYAATKPEWASEVTEIVAAEMRNVARGKITEEEFRRAQNQLVGNTLLGLETTDAWMSHIARSEIYYGEQVSLEDIADAVRGVSYQDLLEFAASLFNPASTAVTLLGDLPQDHIRQITPF
jgi:predicted Zn-dependent peptidase